MNLKKNKKKKDKLVSSGFIFYIYFIHILYIYRHLDTNEISTLFKQYISLLTLIPLP